VKNSKDFVDKIKDVTIDDDEELRSYDVTALFTSVPVDKALVIIQRRLESDISLKERTNLNPDQITRLLKLCLETTYFVYDGVYYKQIHGAAMGSSVSPIVCNLYLEDLEQRALQTAPHPPGWWFRYVDDTHCKIKRCFAHEFTEHLNSLDPDIKFTTEAEDNNSIAFLDTLTTRTLDNKLKVTIYRKPTHTDQYLNFGSNHPLQHKLGVIRTLFHRAKSIITNKEDLELELDHVSSALQNCGYPSWTIAKVKRLTVETTTVNTTPTNTTTSKSSTDRNKGIAILPYVKGLSETLKRLFQARGIQTCFKPVNTLRQVLVAPKDKSKKEETINPVYYIPCDSCKDSYIGETERTLKTRFLEHRRPSSSDTSEVANHIHKTCPTHAVDIKDVIVLDRDPRWFERGVKEAIYIRAVNPSLNRDGGRYHLPEVYTNIIRAHVRSDVTSHQ